MASSSADEAANLTSLCPVIRGNRRDGQCAHPDGPLQRAAEDRARAGAANRRFRSLGVFSCEKSFVVPKWDWMVIADIRPNAGSATLRFSNPRHAPTAAETTQVGNAIYPVEARTADGFGEEAEGDAVPIVTQRVVGVRDRE